MISACWIVVLQLAPWLFLGTLLSGLLFVFLPSDLVRKKFHGFGGILKSVGLGIPLPLCSCGVIPAGIGLKKQGASDGAAIGFLISTPQTGVDSILVASSFFGWGFAFAKMAAAAVIGIFGGLFADRVSSDRTLNNFKEVSDVEHSKPNWNGFVEHCFEILRSIWGWLLIGILISAAIETYVPKSWLTQVNDLGVLASMGVALVIATPLYVCATASVPIAASLVAGGLSPAAAMVFLMAGPATNVTTIGAIKSQFGWKTTSVYIGSIVVGSLLAGWMFESLVTNVNSSTHHHSHDQWWELLAGIGFVILTVWFLGESGFRRWQKIFSDTNDAQEFGISGMHCDGCVRKLENGLRELEGTLQVVVDLKKEVAFVSGRVAKKTVEEKIHSLGFRLKSD